MSGDTDRGPNSLKLKDVYTALYDATDKWFNMGLQLNVDPNDLKRILNEGTLQNNTERLREMLTARLDQGDLTWDQITEALENPTVGKKVIADKITKKYITPQLATTTLPVEGANSMPVMSPVTSTATGLTTETHTTTTTTPTNMQLHVSMNSKQPTTPIANTPQASSTNNSITPEASGTQERGHSSTAQMGKKRPTSSTSPEALQNSRISW
ncbi:uncharacterized protein LOC135339799 isoform X2 [Halichondria panicea]|uniref:uncharacterized protein LOC135339799 isoform X2 n=1 Tax=Halichondria panicea TaxID=6063 RepID=UPI00312B7142